MSYLSFSFSLGITFTGISPTLLPLHVDVSSPRPALEVSKQIPIAWPASTIVVGGSVSTTSSARAVSRFSLNGDPGMGCLPQVTSSVWCSGVRGNRYTSNLLGSTS